jgi:branched-chain amino acid transport system substrate-binding protein
MKRPSPLIGLGFLAFAALVAASPGSAGAADVIKFGVSTPLSGPAAPWGIPHKNATELIFEEFNSQGGLVVGG